MVETLSSPPFRPLGNGPTSSEIVGIVFALEASMSRAHAACSVPKSHGQVVIPAAVVEALDACKQACRSGATYGDIFDDSESTS